MKKVYVKPQMSIEALQLNQAIAQCSWGTTYNYHIWKRGSVNWKTSPEDCMYEGSWGGYPSKEEAMPDLVRKSYAISGNCKEHGTYAVVEWEDGNGDGIPTIDELQNCWSGCAKDIADAFLSSGGSVYQS